MSGKYEQLIAGESGWCRWVTPIHGSGKRNYKFSCCDCSLVHEMQFRVIKDRRGRFNVIFRAKRNNRATAAKRRKK